MKLKNKKTGEIIDLSKGSIREASYGHKIQLQALDRHNKPIWMYSSLAELNSEWEDYEEPKPWWYIDITLTVKQGELFLSKHAEQFKTVGNYFDTREEAEKAVEKLKAWKRLEDKGFKFERWFQRWLVGGEYNDETRADLDLLFGGEE